MDIVDKVTRSRMMSSIRGYNTKPEMIVRKYLHSRGFRYRLHRKDFPGRPDLVLKKYNIVIFVHGCFWHKHRNCHYASLPKSRPKFWAAKLESNVEHDKRAVIDCLKLGWRVLIIWECGTKHMLEKFATMIELINHGFRGTVAEWPQSPPRLRLKK